MMGVNAMRVALIALVCVAASSCSLYQIKRPGAGKDEKVAGIPFLSRVPVEYQTTKYAQLHWKVKFVLTVSSEKEPVEYPPVPFDVVASPEAAARIQKILAELQAKKSSFNSSDEFGNEVATLLQEDMGAWRGCKDGAVCPIQSNLYTTLVESKTEVVSELSRQTFYVNTKRPLMGSANATVKLSEAGTLTDAAASIESKTGETLLAAIPTTAFFQKQWALGGASIKNLSGGLLRSPTYTIHVDAQPVYWLYELRKKCPGECEVAALQFPGTGVQLVKASEMGGGEGSDGKGAKGGKTAWTLTGSVEPPQPEK